MTNINRHRQAFKKSQRIFILLTLSSICIFQSARLDCLAEERGPKASTPGEFYSKLDQLNRKILLKDIELERFNIRFRQASNVQGRWRGLRYFISQEANAGGTMAGLWSGLAVREAPIIHPLFLDLNSKGKLVVEHRGPFRIGIEETIESQLIGQSAGAFGSTVELGINYFHDHQARQNGFDPATAIKHAEGIKKDLEDLFSQRTFLLQSNANAITIQENEIAAAQGIVLRDLCDLALNEYARFHINARRFRAFQDSLYIIDIARNAAGIAGNIIALDGTEVRRRSFNGPAGLLTLVSGVMMVANPLASRLVGKLVSLKAEHQLEHLTENSNSSDLAKLMSDRAKLAELIKKAPVTDSPDEFFSQTVELESINALDTKAHQKKLELATRETAAGTRAASQNIAAGTIIGGTKMVLGITVAIGGFRFYNHPIQANNIIAAGLLTYGVGSSIGVVDNIRIQATNEISRRKLSKLRQLPGQILGDHLKELDQIESRLALH